MSASSIVSYLSRNIVIRKLLQDFERILDFCIQFTVITVRVISPYLNVIVTSEYALV